ncbi:MAG: amidohydrolase family protein [Acidobacteria bacterium]|nr:amidohydrolase family protein [Acidobacteriota bacterium]
MSNRRNFLKGIAGAAAGAYVAGRPGNAAARQGAPARRQVTIGGKRVRVIDIHAHATVREVEPVVKGTEYERQAGGRPLGPDRIALIDRQGIDVQVLSINGFWWWEVKDRGLADRIVRAQNEGLARFVAQYPDRFVAMASTSLQFPDLAAQQLEDGVKRLGLRAAAIGGHVGGEDLSLPKFDPFWAKAAELGVVVFMHPGGADNIVREGALRDRGDLGNIIGNPLETTYFLSRLIFDGTFDRFPNLRVGAAHAGGYLPSYVMRTEVACDVRTNANCANRKRPKEYLRSQVWVDTMVFSDEGLRHLVNEMGPSQIVYGTDNPLNWPVTVDLVLDASWLSNADKEAILGGNLTKLLQTTS